MVFRKFETSSGKLVLAGKDAENNEELIKQVEPEEYVFHTAKPGSPFVNIKNKSPSKEDIKESAAFCAAKSQDWRDNKSDVEVHWFKGKDVSKRKGAKTGTFEVKKFKKILIKKQEVERFLKNQLPRPTPDPARNYKNKFVSRSRSPALRSPFRHPRLIKKTAHFRMQRMP